jgi:hypothetical protein
MNTELNPSKIFISYSHDSDAHSDRVLERESPPDKFRYQYVKISLSHQLVGYSHERESEYHPR